MNGHAEESPDRFDTSGRGYRNRSATFGRKLGFRHHGLSRASHENAHVSRAPLDRSREVGGAVEDISQRHATRRRRAVLHAQQMVHVLRE